MTEVGQRPARRAPRRRRAGDQFRVYELAGIAHLDTRDVEPFRPNPCANPISLHPIGTGFSLALSYLLQWVDKGQAPPHAARILVDRDMTNDGSMMALDEQQRARRRAERVRERARRSVRRAQRSREAVSLESTSVGGPRRGGRAGVVPATAYQQDFTRDQLAALYGTKAAYRAKVAESFDALSRAGGFARVQGRRARGCRQGLSSSGARLRIGLDGSDRSKPQDLSLASFPATRPWFSRTGGSR